MQVTKNKILVIILFLIGLSSISLFLFNEINKSKIFYTYSIVCSLQESLDRTKIELKVYPTKTWRVLNKNEGSELMNELALKKITIDNGKMVDSWGEQLQVATIIDTYDKVSWFVWSNGPDRKPSTNDDIVSAKGEINRGDFSFR